MTLVALSAAYGAAGSRIGPALAERLEVPFLDRAIPLAVADRLDVPFDEVAAHDDHPAGSWLERALRGFIGGDTGIPTPVPAATFSSEDFRRATEEVLHQQARSGRGVILGRAGVVVLREDPRVFRVRLDGPPERRVEQAVRLGVARGTAEQAQRQFDRAHHEYVRHLYGADLGDPALYHLQLDSTAMPLDACVDILETAVRSFSVAPGQGAAGDRTGA
jgi:Cytidylate kinase-like family